jgi:hypothetical protein
MEKSLIFYQLGIRPVNRIAVKVKSCFGGKYFFQTVKPLCQSLSENEFSVGDRVLRSGPDGTSAGLRVSRADRAEGCLPLILSG